MSWAWTMAADRNVNDRWWSRDPDLKGISALRNHFWFSVSNFDSTTHGFDQYNIFNQFSRGKNWFFFQQSIWSFDDIPNYGTNDEVNMEIPNERYDTTDQRMLQLSIALPHQI